MSTEALFNPVHPANPVLLLPLPFQPIACKAVILPVVSIPAILSCTCCSRFRSGLMPDPAPELWS